MTITNENAYVIGLGNGVTRTWTYDFLIPKVGGVPQVQVYVCDTTGTLPASALIDPSQYTITGADDPNGGTVVYPKVGVNPVLATGFNIEIRRGVPYSQVLAFEQNSFYPPDVETGLDQDVLEIQQLAGLAGRSLVVPPGSLITPEQYVILLCGGGGGVIVPSVPIFPSRTLTGNEPIAVTDYFLRIAAGAANSHVMPSPADVVNQDFSFKNAVDWPSTIIGNFDGVANFIIGNRWQIWSVHSNGSVYDVIQNLIP